MAEVKWIKTATGIFDDEKILLIDNMPNSDSYLIIWFKLLCLAGKQNNGGVFMLNNKIPYTEDMLSTIFHRPIKIVKKALEIFESYGMIEIIDNVITIPNWEKHQSLGKLEDAKEKTRKRVAKHREKQKLFATSNVTVTDCNVTVTDCNADRIEREKEEEKNRGREESNALTLGKFNNVFLSQSEYGKLVTEYPNHYEAKIERLSRYIQQKGKKYDNHYAVLLDWLEQDVEKEKAEAKKNSSSASYDIDELENNLEII